MSATKTLTQILSEATGRTLSFNATKSEGGQAGYTASFTGTSGDPCEILNFSVADNTDAALASLNDMGKRRLIQEGRDLLVKNVLVKGGKVVLTKHTKIMGSQAMEIPAAIQKKGEDLISPPSPRKTLRDVRAMPRSSLVSVAGQVVKDEAVRNVNVGSESTEIRTIRLSDDGEELNVTLWRELSATPFRVGQYVELTHCITGFWQNKPQLNSTRNTAITEIEAPETSVAGSLEGITLGDTTAEIAVNCDGAYKDLTVAIGDLRHALDCPEEEFLWRHWRTTCCRSSQLLLPSKCKGQP